LIGVTASGSTSIVQLVLAGLGYAVVPRWMVPMAHPDIAQVVLREVKPMRVYFASTTLLASNTFVQQLHRTCCEVIGPALDTLPEDGSSP
jgi:DNA-binding transcriptional LysR family regulator